MRTTQEQAVMDAMGRRIRGLRTELRWSAEDLARRADVTLATISRIETGRRYPRIATLAKIAKALGVGVESLLADAPKKRRAS